MADQKYQIILGLAIIFVVALLFHFGTREKEVLVPIISTNDIHGTFYERNYVTEDNVSYTMGGLQFFESYVRLLREEFGPNGCLYLDGGDQYQGAIESQLTNGSIIAEFMNIAQPNATTIGNHEYDNDIDFLLKKIRESNFPFLACNVYDKITNNHSPFGPNQLTSKVYDIKTIKGKEFKIGVIGLTYDMRQKKITGKGFENITFDDYVEAIEREASTIRENDDVDAMILLSHIGLNCGKNTSLNNYTKDVQQSNCSDETELYEVLQKLKPGTIDAVVSADTHYEVHHWVNDIPVISGINNGGYTNIMYLPFKRKGFNKYKLKKDEIFIEGALPICDKVFENYKKCDAVTSAKNLGNLVNLTFHGKNMETSDEVKELWEKYYELFQKANVHLFYMRGPSDIEYGGEDNLNGDNPFGNMISDFIKETTNSDFSTINPGTFRTYWSLGSVTEADVKTMFPYSNSLCSIKLKGNQIKEIFSKVHYGSKHKGPYNTAGLYHESDGEKVTKVQMYDKDGNLKDIPDNEDFILSSTDFMLKPSTRDGSYGDDFDDVRDVLKTVEKYDCHTKTIADDLIVWLREKKEIDMTNYIDEKHPRFVILK